MGPENTIKTKLEIVEDRLISTINYIKSLEIDLQFMNRRLFSDPKNQNLAMEIAKNKATMALNLQFKAFLEDLKQNPGKDEPVDGEAVAE